MARAEKLTTVVSGKTVASQDAGPAGTTIISFEDGSKMALVGTVPLLPVGRTLRAVRQNAAILHFDFDDGSSSEVTLHDTTSSVQVENKLGEVEYMG